MTQRTIKFRAWDKEEKEWCEIGGPNFMGIDPLGNVISENGEGHEVELMQFTGLLDKNGKEIYEGDVIKGKRVYSVKVEVFEVRYDELWSGFLPFSNDKDGNCFQKEGIKTLECEIIGNVMESPSLLK